MKNYKLTIMMLCLSASFAFFLFYDTFSSPQQVIIYDGQGNHTTHDSPTSRQLNPIENIWSWKNMWSSTIMNGTISDETYQRNFYLGRYPGIALLYDSPTTIKGIETDRIELVMANDIYMTGFYLRDAHTHEWHILFTKTDLDTRINKTIANLSSN